MIVKTLVEAPFIPNVLGVIMTHFENKTNRMHVCIGIGALVGKSYMLITLHTALAKQRVGMASCKAPQMDTKKLSVIHPHSNQISFSGFYIKTLFK